ncbi:MAG: hypothetical protein KGI11_09050 [Thaumarchaeota archaeon]|nr:hypothetical protein [Nitrososphaerota archaeon]
MITQDTLVGFMQQEVSQDCTRLQALSREMLETDTGSFKKACKDAATEHPEYKTRISEARQIYGAVRFAGMSITAGWQESVTLARNALKSHNITWEGTTPKTAEEKEADRFKRDRRSAANEVNKGFNWGQANAAEAFAEAVEAEYAKMQAEREAEAHEKRMADVHKTVKAIMAMGSDYALAIYDGLGAVLFNAPATGTGGV